MFAHLALLIVINGANLVHIRPLPPELTITSAARGNVPLTLLPPPPLVPSAGAAVCDQEQGG